MVSYSSGLMMRSGRPGRQAYAPVDDGHIAEYANASGGTRATATITVADATANGTVTFYFDARGQEPRTVDWLVPSPVPTGQALYDAILAEIKKDPFILGLGTFTATATAIAFTSFEVGQALTISGSGATVTATVTNGVLQGKPLKPGTAVVVDPTVLPAARDPEFDSVLEFALPPSQLFGDAGTTQEWRGVVMDSDSEMEDNYSGYPDFSNLETVRRIPSISVKEYGHIRIELETPYTGTGVIPPLLCRYAVDGDKDTLGAFSLAAGAGLAEVPVGYRIKKVLDNGTMLIVDFDKK